MVEGFVVELSFKDLIKIVLGVLMGKDSKKALQVWELASGASIALYKPSGWSPYADTITQRRQVKKKRARQLQGLAGSW